MRDKRFYRQRGFSLLEITMAMAIFMIVLGATAQSLITFYESMDLQRQRITAIRNCDSVLADMRALRNANPGNFPNALVAQWPNQTVVPNAGTLPNETITITYASVNANPLEVTATSRWFDMRRRPATARVSTLLTDR